MQLASSHLTDRLHFSVRHFVLFRLIVIGQEHASTLDLAEMPNAKKTMTTLNVLDVFILLEKRKEIRLSLSQATPSLAEPHPYGLAKPHPCVT